MKLLLLFITVLLPLELRAETAGEIEERTRQNLQRVLDRLVAPDEYVINVIASGDKVMQKEVIEGESVTSSNPGANVPALPGFSVPTDAGSGTTRQTFKMRESLNLRSLKVQLLFDRSISEEIKREAETIVRDHLRLERGNLANLSVGVAPLRASRMSNFAATLTRLLPWLALAAIVLAFGYWWMTRRQRRRESLVSPSDPQYPELVGAEPVGPKQSEQRQLPGSTAMAALPDNRPKRDKGEDGETSYFPPLPATEAFTDRRAELLDEFLKNSEIFRLYYQKLSEGSQAELYAGLRGPAFDNLLEMVGLPIPSEALSPTPPTEEQMDFYRKNFLEFLRSMAWQEQQFFGFIHNLEDLQIVKIMQQVNSLVAAVILNFLPAARSAKVLDGMPREKRVEVLSMLQRCRDLPIAELKEMENSVRDLAAQIPRLSGYQQRLDMRFWSKLLTHAENQDQILMDLEEVYPDLYPKLAKFRFRFEDIPSLPKPLIQKILDQIDNDKLAMALVGLDASLTSFILAELNNERRPIVENQILINQGLPDVQGNEHRTTLTRMFREVLA